MVWATTAQGDNQRQVVDNVSLAQGIPHEAVEDLVYALDGARGNDCRCDYLRQEAEKLRGKMGLLLDLVEGIHENEGLGLHRESQEGLDVAL